MSKKNESGDTNKHVIDAGPTEPQEPDTAEAPPTPPVEQPQEAAAGTVTAQVVELTKHLKGKFWPSPSGAGRWDACILDELGQIIVHPLMPGNSGIAAYLTDEELDAVFETIAGKKVKR